MCCYDLIVSQETGFVDAIVKKDLHTVMLLFFFLFLIIEEPWVK